MILVIILDITKKVINVKVPLKVKAKDLDKRKPFMLFKKCLKVHIQKLTKVKEKNNVRVKKLKKQQN